MERSAAAIVTDPLGKNFGFEPPRLKADVVTVSHDAPGHSNLSIVKGARAITGPGEYEIGGAFITGVRTTVSESEEGAEPEPDNTAYVIEYESASVCHLGDLSDIPAQPQVEVLGTVDVLLVPVGSGNGLNAAQAAEIISLIQPSIVVPMHYKTHNNKLKLDPLSRFLKEMGLGKVPPEQSLKVTKSSLPEETQVVVLEPKGG
jgi:L-ascorbate metabolism protein UlaG (beta-lactamase superfamily)